MDSRCTWCCDDGLMQAYHDGEWGIPLHDDQRQFEFLTLEVMQCGLNWMMMLKKREVFRECFENFDFQKIACYDSADIQRIMETPNMIKSIRKIQAVISNACAFLEIIRKYGSFDRFLWSFTNGKILVYPAHQQEGVARNELSDQVSAALKKRGFKFLGSITVYSHLQACGIINDHEESCFRYQDILAHYPVEIRS